MTQTNAVAARPAPPTFLGEVRSLLGKMQGQIALALPKHLTPDRMIRVALTTLQRTPEIQRCSPLSVVGGIVQASQLGLEIDGVLGHAYLVPFKGQCQLIIGYKGYVELAHRAGCHMVPRIVHANDGFSCEYGSDPCIRHTPSILDPGAPIAVYCTATFAAGGKDFDVIPWPEILAYQTRYRTAKGGPWVDHLEEMAKKTAIRRLAKRCPVSVEFRRAVDLETAAEQDRPQNLEQITGLTRADEVLARLSAADEPMEMEADPDGAAERAAIEGGAP